MILTKIFHRWLHLRHSDHVCNGAFSSNDTEDAYLAREGREWLTKNSPAKRIGILFSQLLKQNDSQLLGRDLALIAPAVNYTTYLAEELIFVALFNDNGQASSQVRGLLSNFRTLVVQPPENR